MCEHKFVYGGVKYRESKYSLSGTGAKERKYFDWYFCEKCLERKFQELDFTDTSYDKIKFNATPTSAD